MSCLSFSLQCFLKGHQTGQGTAYAANFISQGPPSTAGNSQNSWVYFLGSTKHCREQHKQLSLPLEFHQTLQGTATTTDFTSWGPPNTAGNNKNTWLYLLGSTKHCREQQKHILLLLGVHQTQPGTTKNNCFYFLGSTKHCKEQQEQLNSFRETCSGNVWESTEYEISCFCCSLQCLVGPKR